MNQPNQHVLPGDSVKLTGGRYFDLKPQLWTWSESSTDRPLGAVEPILKLVVREDGEDVVLEGEICDFMERD